MRKFAGVSAGILLAATAVLAFSSGGASAAATDLVVTGPGEGGSPSIRTFGPDGKDGGVAYSSNGTSTSGAVVAAGDVTGDGTPEIVTGTGPGLLAQVQVWSKDGKALVAQANPFPNFGGGISVALANIDDTPQLEVIVAAGAGGGPHVKALRVANGQLQEVYSFFAYDPAFRGGVYVAGSAGRIITGAGAGGGPHVRVFKINQGVLSVEHEWMAYGTFGGGVRVAAGGVRNATDVDVVTGAGPGGGPHVKVWSVAGVEGPGFMAYDPTFSGGVWVAVGQGHLITGAGAGGGPHVIVRTAAANSTWTINASFFAYLTEFHGGVHVGAFPATTPPPTTTTTGGVTTTTTCTGFPPLCLPGGGDTTTTTPGATTTTVAPTTTTTVAPTTTTVAPTTTTVAPTSSTSTPPTTSGLPIPG
jgi:hypothetical protein